eukprot:513283-Pelagomonas_calceolata.AAC.2
MLLGDKKPFWAWAAPSRSARIWSCLAWRWQLRQQLGAVGEGLAGLTGHANLAPLRELCGPHNHNSQPRKRGQGQEKGLRHKGASFCTKPRAGVHGAGASKGE